MSRVNSQKRLEEIFALLIDLPLRAPDINTALKNLTLLCRDALESQVCTLTWINTEKGLSTQAAGAEFDSELEELVAQIGIQLGHSQEHYLTHPKVGEAGVIKNYDLGECDDTTDAPLARKHGLRSVMSQPLISNGQVIGFLNHFSTDTRPFSDDEENLLKLFSRQAENIIKQFTNELSRTRLEAAIQAMMMMAESRKIEKVLTTLIKGSLVVGDVSSVWVQRINSRGELEVTAKLGASFTPPSLTPGEGITWKAIRECQPQVANDTSVGFSTWYSHSITTKSVLAIPLLVDNVPVLEGTRVKLRSRPIGVLNLESPHLGAFSERHIAYLLPLAQQAAILVDWLEADQKLRRLREVGRDIVGKKNWRDILQIVVRAIKDTGEFDYVNVSLVDKVHSLIRSQYVIGLPEHDIEDFKKVAVYQLDADSIQADVVRTARVEVVAADDARLDRRLYERFEQNNMIRVFVPMIVPSTSEVIGTIEAGYKRGFRDFISEADIQFLQSFVAYAVEAIEPSKRLLVETVSHELRSSITGIRSNADFLRLQWDQLSPEMISNKLNDILIDSEILKFNVSELEYFLGRPPVPPKQERVSLVRDVIVKIVSQLSPLVLERRLDHRRILLPNSSIRRIQIYTDRTALNQVVYNLLLNAIKYAEDDPNTFRIEIDINDLPNTYVVRLADWGIGVEEGLEEKIFQYGFRSAKARSRDVSGSGLGLAIARDRMREIGGDLILVKNFKPTEFQILIPKTLAETLE